MDEDDHVDRDVTNENSESDESFDDDGNVTYDDDEDEDGSEVLDADLYQDYSECEEAQKLKIIRVTAAAGSGKTTTLIGFSERLIQMGRTNITYLTYSKALAKDAERRMDEHVTCQTIHSAALRALNLPERVNAADDNEVDAYILEEYQDSINEFLSTV